MDWAFLLPSTFKMPYTWYSFGVEMEFIVKFRIDDFIPEENRGCAHLIQYPDLMRTVYRRIVTFMRDHGFMVHNYPPHCVNLSYWKVKIPPPNVQVDGFDIIRDEWGFCPVKLVAPVMSFTGRSFHTIQEALNSLTGGFDILTNNSCSLNVHVGSIIGDRDGKIEGHDLQSIGFRLTALENLLALVWMYQKQLNAIHPSSRVNEAHVFTPSALLSHLNPRIVKQRILDCTSTQALCQLWDGSKARYHHPQGIMAYSIEGMVAHSTAGGAMIESGNRTVRFGQHRGTVDPSEIQHWVILVGRLVELADEIVPWCWPLSIALRRSKNLPVKLCEISTVQLLEGIKVPVQARFYARRLHTHETGVNASVAGSGL
ncbi:uncharacterized protein GIQ15_00955 [Arthroderma uncinatum]|uniref:uncharacterized protein n=1 Tax=Arthroderma uncinatum TaxID=74035 RepID=UPI00144A5836|nr:uncharacterized protein GIQ15_00955 [Arthroderma uncinatum]KAF3491438.1 hypothetical protein GIQ15_00955 [Arthroderma uncinatum]